MLRFFRNIRQKLIEQENVRKYIWYALGEIILVMVGILLALQVNTWNNSRLEQIESEIAEKRLLNDLKEELGTMEASLNYGNTVIKYATSAMDIYENDNQSLEIDSDKFLIDLYQASQLQEGVQTGSAYQELLSSGKLNLIKDDEIRANLISFYSYNWPNSIVFRINEPYREQIRKEIPNSIQTQIREECGDMYTKIRGTLRVVLPETCATKFDPVLSEKTARVILKNSSLKKDLRFRIGNLDAQMLLVKSFKEDVERIITNLENQ